MPSDKRNSILAIAKGLISSLSSIALSGDVPFCQPQQLQCLHHGSTKAHLCSPLYSIPFSLTAQVMICGTHFMALVRDLGKCSASRGASYVILCIECYPNVRRAGSEMKRNDTQC